MEVFYVAAWEQRYDDAMEHVSPQSKWVKSKWDLQKVYHSLHQISGDGSDSIEIRIYKVEYLDKTQTMAEAKIEIYNNKDKTWERIGVELQKENGVWKILTP